MNNLRTTPDIELPKTHTQAQYKILCNLIIQKKITKKFFDFIVKELYEVDDWHELNYCQVYQLIHVLTYFDYEKVRM